MPSSTSSSERTVPTAADGRSVAVRVLVASVLVLVCGVVGARTILGRFPKQLGAHEARWEELLRQLPAIHGQPDDKLVFTFGSSLVEDGFSPADFDEEAAKKGLETTAFNLAVFDTTPALLRPLTRRVARELGSRGSRLGAAYLEFNPHLSTKKAFDEEYGNNELRMGVVLEPNDYLRLGFQSPTRTARELALGLLGWHRPGEATEAVRHELFQPKPPPFSPDFRRVAFSPMGRKLRISATWSMEARGETPRATTPEELEVARKLTVYRNREVELSQLRGWDFQDLDFAPESIADLLASYRELERASRRVYLLVMPRQEAFKPTPIGRKRLEQVLEHFRAEGVQIANFFDDPDFEPDDFRDNTHLTKHAGRRKLSVKLADHLARETAGASVR